MEQHVKYKVKQHFQMVLVFKESCQYRSGISFACRSKHTVTETYDTCDITLFLRRN